MTKMTLVTGATGNTDRPLAELLCQRGVPVRAMVHSATSREQFTGLPVEVIVADLDDAEAVSAALAGIQGLLAVSGPIRTSRPRPSRRPCADYYPTGRSTGFSRTTRTTAAAKPPPSCRPLPT